MLDISNICRICLKEEDPKLPIFTENDDKSESKPTLPEKIMSFARVKVVKDDGLPMYICVKCYCQVDTTVEFKRLCEESFHFFTQQLDSFSNGRSMSPYNSEAKETSDGYETNVNQTNNPKRPETSFDDAVLFSQHWIIPEDSIKQEEYDPEYVGQEEPTTQVFRITGNDESWIDNGETEVEPTVIKCEPTWEYPNFEFDLSNVKIENGSEMFDEERVNPLEINPEDIPNIDRSPYYDVLTPTSSMEKTCKCRSCEMVFSNRREMGFHISVAHRRCGTCGKYFFSNKDKDGHKCSGSPLEEKAFVPNRVDKAGQCCHLCNKTVKQMRSHMAWHRKRKLKLREKETDLAIPQPISDSLKQELDGSEDKIKCRLCDAVCAGQKGFKIHLTCMHSDHRLVYACFVCKSRKFYSKASCNKHVMKKHGIVANGNIQFELKHVADCQRDVKGILKRGNFAGKSLPDCIEIDVVKKVSPQGKAKGKRVDIVPRRSGMRALHPPFSTQIPIIPNNFDVTLDVNGVKRYICRGCNVMYKRYISAYNHYYTHSKKAAKAEQNQLVIDSKPYNCKFCTLKFASRSQAMMHRIHAHKYFYKKFALEKK